MEMRKGLESSWVEQTSFLRHSTAKRSIHSLSECEYCAYYKYCNENTFEQNSMAWRVKKTNGSTFPGFTRLQDAFSNWTNSLNQTRLHRDIRKSELEIRHETVTTFMLTNCKWIYMEILLSMNIILFPSGSQKRIPFFQYNSFWIRNSLDFCINFMEFLKLTMAIGVRTCGIELLTSY